MASSRMTEQIGRVLGERYRLRAPIGRGASAQVYLADDVRLRRSVAIKVLHDALADDQAFIRRFRAEAQAAAALNHPHVMAVYDWGEDDEGIPWIVTEYLGGGSLRGLLDRGHRLTPSQALVVGLQAARGLDYAHRRGFVHRDVKPANLLFDDDGRLRIADFGLARALAEAAWTEPAGAVVGTARYASPEQAQGLTLTGRADVYALALVLVESVTGEVPFSADTTLGTLMARVGHDLVAPDSLGPLGGPVAAAGRADPEERIDARRLAGALARVAEDLPRPAPLPLAGALDVALTDDDPTVLAGSSGVAGSAAAVGLVAGASAGGALEAGPAEGDASPADGARPTPSGAADGAEPGAPSDEEATLVEEGAPDLAAAPDDHTLVEPTWAPPPEATAVAAPAFEDVELFDDAGEDTGDDLVWDPRNPDGRPRRRWPVRILFGLLIVGLSAAVALLAADLVEDPAVRTVPDVTAQDPDEAQRLLEDLGFEVSVERVREDGTVAGEVVGTRPAPGTALAEGETVTLLVSEGQPIVDLPAVEAGMTRQEAEDLLRFSGLVPVVSTRFDEEVEAGVVIEVTGDPPARIEKGAEVGLLVSDGPAPREVPELAGLTEDDAVAALEDLGLVADVTPRYSDDVEAGLVIGTEPASGAEVPRGETVALLVSRGPDLVTVPDVTSAATLDEAVALLEAAGLVSGEVQGPAAGSPSGTDPGAGTQVRRGAEVDIVLE